MTQPLWGQYERLRPAQIDAIRESAPVAYIPWGALEWHSYHNPVGLDCLKAHGLMCEVARRVGGVVVPPVYIGTDTIKPLKGFPHTLDFPDQMVKALARQFLDQLADEKFRVIVLFTGHYGGRHLEVLTEAATEFNESQSGAHAWFTSDYYILRDQYEANHAAWGETSFQMLFDDSLVRLDALPAERVAELDRDGVMGRDPRESSVDGGQEQLAAFLRGAVPKVNELLSEAGVR